MMDSSVEELRVISFAFAPGDYVTVTHLGLGFKGRVTRCVWGASAKRYYEVDFNAEGEIKCREFYEDEIEPRSK
jgi:hypothetical protein